MMKKPLGSLLLTLALVSSAPALWAHSALTISEPSAGSVLSTSPTQLTLTYSGAVRLINLTLLDAAGQPVTLETSRVMSAQKRFQLPLPTLPAGSYQVQWTAMGGDGHKMSGQFEFEID